MRTICTNGVSNTTVTKNEESFKIFFQFHKKKKKFLPLRRGKFNSSIKMEVN